MSKRARKRRNPTTRTTTKTLQQRVVRKNARKLPRAARAARAACAARAARAARRARAARAARAARRRASATRSACSIKAARVAARAARRYTVAFTPTAAKSFIQTAPKARAAEVRTLQRRHPSGGVYVPLGTWHGSEQQAEKLAGRLNLLLAYAAGRKRAGLSTAGVRVVTVP